METRRMQIDFFKVRVEGKDISTLVRQVFDKEEENRNASVRSHVYRMQVLKRHGRLLIGEMIRLRMDDAALKGKLSGGPPDEIALDEDESLAEETAFAIHMDLEVLMLQRHRAGTSPWTLAAYLEDLSGFKPIMFDPILEKGALKKLAKMQDIRSFDFQVAGANQAIYDNLGLSMKEMGKLAERMGAPQVRLRMSMGRRAGALSTSGVMEMALALFNRSAAEGDVERIRITGRDSHGELETLDLLRHRMIESAEVGLEGNRIPFKQRAGALVRANEKREADLQEMFGA